MLSLRERYQTSLKKVRPSSEQSPQIGDVVLIKENLPRGSWKLAKILDLILGSDGLIGSAKVLLATKKILHGAVNQLCPLECSSFSPNQVDEKLDEEQHQRTLPLGQAAFKAKEHLGRFFDSSDKDNLHDATSLHMINFI